MRILVVTPWYPTADAPDSGIFVAREAHALAADHDVRVLHLDWNGPDHRGALPETVPVRRIALRRTRPIDFLRARRAVRRAAESADIVHTHALTGLVPWVLDRPAPKPWVHSEHWSAISSPETRGRAERVALRMLSPALSRPDVVVAESSRLAAAIGRVRTGRLEIVPCVVDAVRPTPRPVATRMVSIGGLIDRKDPLLAVETLAVLRSRGVDADLTLVGEGPLRDKIRFRSEELGVAEHVVLTGRLPAAGVSERLDAAAVLLLPTRGENFCVVAAEALVHGRPLVSGAATGAVDYAPAHVSRFVESRRAVDYADAVQSVLRESSDMTATQIADTVAGRFSPEAVSVQLTRIYEQVASG